jgi:hypothetical protein
MKSELFNRYVLVGISEKFGHNHTDLQSVTQALAHDPSVNYSTAQRPKRRGFKFEKNREKDATGSRKKLLGYGLAPAGWHPAARQVLVGRPARRRQYIILHPLSPWRLDYTGWSE